MKVAAITTMALSTVIAVQAAESLPAAARSIIVCVNGDAGLGIKTQAQTITSEMFATIGVSVDWRKGVHDCPPHKPS